MATKEQVEAMLEKKKATRPYHFFQRFDVTQAGMDLFYFCFMMQMAPYLPVRLAIL